MPGSDITDRSCVPAPWTRQFGTSGTDAAYGVAVDPGGSVLVAGSTFVGPTPGGHWEVFVRKYDAFGTLLWVRQFGTAEASGVSVDSLGNVLVAGLTRGSLSGYANAGESDAFVRKYDAAGSEMWTRQFGSTLSDLARSVAVDTFGNVLLTGDTSGALPGAVSIGATDVFVRKYDPSGNELWTRQFGSPISDEGRRVVVDSSANVLVVGSTVGALPGQTFAGGADVFVRKYDAAGSEVWTRQYGTTDVEFAKAAVVDVTGNVVVVAQAGGISVVRKFDASGNELWTRQPATTYPSALAVDSAGNLVLAGLAPGAGPFVNNDIALRKLDSSGNTVWAQQFGGPGEDRSWGLAVDGLGNILVSGSTTGQTVFGDQDAVVLRVLR